ncbi:MAG: hypothetical protein RLZZ84_871 [Pseudomonadota bacterium]|jgi:hypothetical protein
MQLNPNATSPESAKQRPAGARVAAVAVIAAGLLLGACSSHDEALSNQLAAGEAAAQRAEAAADRAEAAATRAGNHSAQAVLEPEPEPDPNAPAPDAVQDQAEGEEPVIQG